MCFSGCNGVQFKGTQFHGFEGDGSAYQFCKNTEKIYYEERAIKDFSK